MAKKEAQPTQQIIEIEEIRDGVVILKNGALRRILMVSGVNFDLKSEEEQGLMTFAYQNFINGLDFSLQIFIHSRRLNIKGYLEKIEQVGQQEVNELLKNQIFEYKEFIKSFVADNPIMDKTFFVVVPFDPIQIPGKGAGLTDKLLGLIPGKAKKKEEVSKEQETQQRVRHLEQLEQRVDQVISGLRQIGLNAAVLTDENVIELFYNLYNPEAIEKKELEIAKKE